MEEIKDFMERYQREHRDPYQPTAIERFIRVQEYAKTAGLPEAAVRERLKRGLLAGVKMGRSWYVKVKDESSPEDAALIRSLQERVLVLETKLKSIRSISAIQESEQEAGT